MFTLDLFFNLVEGDGQITRRSACDSPSPSTGSLVNHLRPAAIINTALPNPYSHAADKCAQARLRRTFSVGRIYAVNSQRMPAWLLDRIGGGGRL